jgi:putative cardiolipin synthase
MPDDPATALEQLRVRIDEETETIKKAQYAEAVEADFDKYISSTIGIFTWADYELVYDSPDKVHKKEAQEGNIQTITSKLAASIEAAENEVIVVSPYFVPLERGIEYLQSLRDRGIDVTIITNSLAANNHSIVHAGYAPSRKSLLKMGVEIREVRVTAGLDGIERGGAGAKLATLHTKAFLVDCKRLFVGSFNWDPRSVDINTELGVIIESPEMAQGLCIDLEPALKQRTYEVVLNEKGKLRWIDRSGAEAVTYDKEPDTGFWQRFGVGFMKFLPGKGQL